MDLASEIMDVLTNNCFVTEKTWYRIKRRIEKLCKNYVYECPLIKNNPNLDCSLCKIRKCGK